MDWGKLILILYISILLLMFILRDDNQENFIYTASVPVGLPIINTYEGTDIQSTKQDIIGITIKIKDKSDDFTYWFDKKYNGEYQNIRVETEDGISLLDLIPSNGQVSGNLYLSSTDRRYIRNQETYLVYKKDGNKIRHRLRKIRIPVIQK